MRECSPKARESIGEIGRTNCEGITADFGLVPDGFAELVEKEERGAAVWRCGGFLLQTANKSAQPARCSLACPWPERCRMRREFRPAIRPRFFFGVVEHRGRLGRAGRAPQSGPRRVIFPANEQTK